MHTSKSKERVYRRSLLPILAAVTLVGGLTSVGCQRKEEAATGPGGSKLPEHMDLAERVNAIKSNPKYTDAEKQQAIKNVEAQAQLSRGEGGTAPPAGYQP